MSHNTKIYGRAYLPYYLVIYLVRSLADGNIFVIGSYSCIISRFSELGVHSYLHGLPMFISCSLFMLHVLDYMYHQMWFTVLSIIPQKLKKMHVPHLCLLNWRFLGCFCWGF